MARVTLKRRLIRIGLIIALLPPILAAAAGWLVAPNYLRPTRRELTPDLIREADTYFAAAHATRQDFDVRAPDGVLLRAGRSARPGQTARGCCSFTESRTIAWASKDKQSFCSGRVTTW